MRNPIVVAMFLLLTAGCQGTTSVPQGAGGAVGALSQMRAPLPFVAARIASGTAVFSTPTGSAAKGRKAHGWIFASNGEGGNVDVYDQKTFKMISSCPCNGVGLAVEPRSGDLAVGARGAVTLWHVSPKQITQFATLTLSQGPYAIGIAFDGRGNLYAGNAGDNVIDFFTASEIRAGGGAPARTVSTSHLNEVYYLAATGTATLLADGYDMNGRPLLVSVNTKTGADTVLQRPVSGSLPDGIVFDRHQNLIFNTPGSPNVISVYAKPWTGSPTSTLVYGTGASNGYYTGISLNAAQDTLWAANFTLINVSHGATNVQANSYPLGTVGNGSLAVSSEFYDSIAAYPQGKP